MVLNRRLGFGRQSRLVLREAHAPNAYLNDLSVGCLYREGVGWSESQAIYDLANLRSDKKDMDDRSGFEIARVNTILADFESLDKVISFVLDSPLSIRPKKCHQNRTLAFGCSKRWNQWALPWETKALIIASDEKETSRMIIPMSVIHKFFCFCFFLFGPVCVWSQTITPMFPEMLFTIALRPGPELPKD